MEWLLIKVAILLIVFGIFLPSFDTYSDLAFSYSLFTGTYQYYCDRKTISGKIQGQSVDNVIIYGLGWPKTSK